MKIREEIEEEILDDSVSVCKGARVGKEEVNILKKKGGKGDIEEVEGTEGWEKDRGGESR